MGVGPCEPGLFPKQGQASEWGVRHQLHRPAFPYGFSKGVKVVVGVVAVRQPGRALPPRVHVSGRAEASAFVDEDGPFRKMKTLVKTTKQQVVANFRCRYFAHTRGRVGSPWHDQSGTAKKRCYVRRHSRRWRRGSPKTDRIILSAISFSCVSRRTSYLGLSASRLSTPATLLNNGTKRWRALSTLSRYYPCK